MVYFFLSNTPAFLPRVAKGYSAAHNTVDLILLLPLIIPTGGFLDTFRYRALFIFLLLNLIFSNGQKKIYINAQN